MNLEQLTKTQIVLLTLLVSFITSIATGIVTVTLVDQAPADVTRTINTVVEKTVERVVPGETRIVEHIKEISNPTQSDLAVGAIEKNRNQLVKLVSSEGAIVSRGFLVSSNGEATVYVPAGAKEGDEYSMLWLGDKSASTTPITVLVKKISNGVALVAPESKTENKFSFVSLKQAIVPVLGQQVISVGQDSNLGVTVEFSNVVAFIEDDGKEGERRFLISGSGKRAFLGGVLVDLEGRVLGFQVGPMEAGGDQTVIPLSTLDNLFGTSLVVEKVSSDQAANAQKAVN